MSFESNDQTLVAMFFLFAVATQTWPKNIALRPSVTINGS